MGWRGDWSTEGLLDMIDPEEYRDLVEENAMLRKEAEHLKNEIAKLKEKLANKNWPEDDDCGPCAHWDWPSG